MSVPAVEAQTGQEHPGATAPEQVGAPAPGQRPDSSPSSDAAQTQEQSSRGIDYFRQAFSRLPGRQTQTAAPAAPAPQEIRPADSGPSPQAPPASSGAAVETDESGGSQGRSAQTTLPPQRRQQQAPAQPPQNGQIVLTPEEYERRLQSELDRREAKRQKDEQARAERDREVELRRTNPFEYARLMEEKETQLAESQAETKRLTGLLSQQLDFYDRGVLDHFVGALPEPLRAKVISRDEGLPGRRATAEATVKALRQHWIQEGRANARETLLKDQTFIKEILARYGQAPEPEVTTTPVRVRESAPSRGYAESEQNAAMNGWMREASRGIRSSTR